MADNGTPRRPRQVQTWQDSIWASDLPPSGKLTALAVSRYMDFDTLGKAWPGKDRLSADTGLSMASVKRELKRLIGAGWLAETHRGGGRGHASAYRGTFPKGVTVTPFNVERGSQNAIKGVTDDHKGGHSDPPPGHYLGQEHGGAVARPLGGAATEPDVASPNVSFRPESQAVDQIIEAMENEILYDQPELVGFWHDIFLKTDELQDDYGNWLKPKAVLQMVDDTLHWWRFGIPPEWMFLPRPTRYAHDIGYKEQKKAALAAAKVKHILGRDSEEWDRFNENLKQEGQYGDQDYRKPHEVIRLANSFLQAHTADPSPAPTAIGAV